VSDPGPLLEALLEALPDPALLFDADHRLTVANAEARRLLGLREEPYTATQALGTARLADLLLEVGETRRPVRMEAALHGRDVAVSAAPVGEHILLHLRDQTDRQRVDAVRRDFVANASHEMKTPISGIQALAEALVTTLDRDDHDRSRELAGQLASEAARMGRLITELLSLRRLEDDGLRATAPVDLAAVVRDELDRIAETARARDIEVVRDLPETAVVIGSEPDLHLMVTNLLENAVRYNRDAGRIDVELRPQEGTWHLEVVDTGIGIPRQDLDRIFERFYRVDVARSRASGGTGLGLAIVRHAAERHGGAVRVRSILGEGSTFTVDLPVEPSAGGAIMGH